MTLASVQTPADTVPFLGYAEGVGRFLLYAAAFLGVCWLIDRYLVSPYLRGHVTAAIGSDAEVRAFAAEVDAWDAEQTAQARRVR